MASKDTLFLRCLSRDQIELLICLLREQRLDHSSRGIQVRLEVENFFFVQPLARELLADCLALDHLQARGLCGFEGLIPVELSISIIFSTITVGNSMGFGAREGNLS